MRTALSLLALVGLAACEPSNGQLPQGQVVAVVDGMEITLAELQLEIRKAAPGLEVGKPGQLALIKALAARKLLAAAAKDRKLDISPEASRVRSRTQDLALIELLQQDLVPSRPRASEADLTKFVDSHSAIFTSRELITVEQIVFQARSPAILEQLRQTTNLDNAERVLVNQNVRHLRSRQTLDSLYLDPSDASALQSSGRDLVVLQGPSQPARILQVRNRVAAPLAGDEALTAARTVLQRQYENDVKNALEAVIAAGQKRVIRNQGAGPLDAK